MNANDIQVLRNGQEMTFYLYPHTSHTTLKWQEARKLLPRPLSAQDKVSKLRLRNFPGQFSLLPTSTPAPIKAKVFLPGLNSPLL
jgi:hypothetical protein